MYFVYIIQSNANQKWYVGTSEDPERRLLEHNAGKTKSTKGYIPYQLIYKEAYATKREARKREILIKKSGRIRKELKQQLTASSSNG